MFALAQAYQRAKEINRKGAKEIKKNRAKEIKRKRASITNANHFVDVKFFNSMSVCTTHKNAKMLIPIMRR